MLEIPFLLWQSQDYSQSNSLQIKFNRKYTLNDLSHSIADLCGIKSQKVDNSKSVFNSQFLEKPRIVMGAFDFDRWVSHKSPVP